jgi:cobalt-zinc-cadmium efflux system outer membrane protein
VIPAIGELRGLIRRDEEKIMLCSKLRDLRAAIAICAGVGVAFAGAVHSAVQAQEASNTTIDALTLPDAIRMALTHSPVLIAGREEVLAREADTEQAARRLNPRLALEFENWGGSGSYEGIERSEGTLALVHTWETGGKRGKREALFAAETAIAQRDLEQRRLAIVRDVRIAFAELLAAQAKESIALEMVEAASKSAEAAAERVRIGGATKVDELRARLGEAETRTLRERRSREIVAARAALAETWGGQILSFRRAEGNLSTIDPVPSIDEIPARLEQNLELQRAKDDIARLERQSDWEQSLSAPDVDLSAGARRFEEDDEFAWIAGASLPLPLFDTRKGAKSAASHRVERARADEAALRAQIESRARSLHAQILTAGEEAHSIRENLLPQARGARDAAQSAYERGALRYSEVLGAQRDLLLLNERAIEAELRWHVLDAELDALWGEPAAALESEEQQP